ncbi:MAG: GntR family transcriptional regulator [Stappiaceae bacterium]
MTETNLQDRSHVLAEALCEEIVDGTFAPGEKLNEKELATRFKVSRGPIREALKRLAERNLVVLSPNAGAKVAQHTREDIIHLLDVREHLEGAAAKLAAERMTKEEKKRLGALFKAHALAVEAATDGSYVQHPEDLDFHYVIIKGSRNPHLFAILCGDLYPQLRLFRRQHKNTPGRGKRALHEHRWILNAIEDGDPELAELLMRKHISASKENLKMMDSV